MEDKETVEYLIKNEHHLTLATADTEGVPWISPVFFVPDEKGQLFWVSSKNAHHSENIRKRSEVSIVIVGKLPAGDMDGVYIEADAFELTDVDEIEKAIEVFSMRSQPTKFTTKGIEDVTGKAAWRVYKAVPKSVSKRADATDEESGQAITVRKAVDLG